MKPERPLIETDEFAGLLGSFGSADELHFAIELVREASLSDYTAFLPLPDKTNVETAQPGDSPLRFLALGGGVTGILLAMTMTVACSWDYPLVVGGKSITSWPPFLVICFEMMVLFGSFGAIFGFLFLSGLPHVVPAEGYRPDLAIDTFGLFIPCTSGGTYIQTVERVLREAGAEEIRKVYR